MRVSEIPEISQLSIPEKILFIEDLWDSIVLDEPKVSVPQSHMEELDRSLKNYKTLNSQNHRNELSSHCLTIL